MADSILRLKVDSQEYDNKLKRAAEGLKRYADGCRKAGGTLTQLDDGVEDFVRELGKMETVSKSARGSINEMTKAFTDLSVQYNKLTDEEKNSPFGKALAQSLETLKGRIREGNNELKTISGSINDTGGFLNTLKDKFTINIDALKLFNAGVTAAKAALDVAKDAFFASESNVDEWGRTVASAESVYQGFLQSLNNGDFSGFIGHINEIIKKAQEAYNALDELNTRMTIINPERTRLQARATELKAIIRREGASSEKGQAAQSELRQLEGMLTQAFKTESQLNMNAFKAQVDKKLQEAGIKLGKRDYDFLMRTFSSDASYMAMRRGASGSVQMNYEAGGSYDEGSVSKVDTRNINQRLLDLFTDEWRKEYAPLLNAAFSARGGAASTMLGDARYLKGGGGSGGGGGRNGGVSTEITYAADSITAMEKEVSDLTKLWKDCGAAVRDQYAAQLAEAQLRLDTITGKNKKIAFDSEQAAKQVDVARGKNTAQTSGLGNIMSNFDVGTGLSPEAIAAANQWIKNMEEGGNKVRESWKNAASAIGMVGSAMSSVKDPAAQIASTVAMAIANIAMAYSETLAKDTTNKSNIWYFIATAAAAMVSMATTISSIHSATGYAQGGMIKGNSYSGDNIGGVVDGSQLVGLNAGEIVLNQAQTSNVANALKGGGMGGNMHLTARLDGKDLLLSIDRTGQTLGYGQLVFFK